MAAASYTTDLTTIATGDVNVDTGSWGESSDAGWDTGGAMVDDQNLYYNNSECVSAQLTKDSNGTGASGPATIMYVHGSTWVIPTDGAVLLHHLWAAPPALNTLANGGVKILLGNGLGVFSAWNCSGSDFKPAPKGGWTNYALNPAVGTADDVVGGGASSPYTTVGGAVGALAQARGNPHACNAVRYGRCTSIYTLGDLGNGYATFLGFGLIDSIITNKWNLLDPIDGGYSHQGLMSLGLTATVVDFRDSNRNISIANTINVTAGFNAIEIHNASSNVEWIAINISALGTVSKGTFEMIDNATVNIDTCVFTDMSTFIFLSNAVLIATTFRRCDQITHGGADFEGCTFDSYEGTVDTAYLLYNVAVDPNGELDNCKFIKGTAATHAIEFGSTSPATMTLTGCDFSGYNAVDGNNDSALYFPDTGADVAWTVNLSGCTGDITYKKVRAGDTVTLVADQITHTLSGLQNGSEVTYVKRGTAIDTGADGATTLGSRDFATGNAWTVDAYKGHLLEITSGSDIGRYYVSGNSATTLYLDKSLTTTASTLNWELYDENDDTEVFHVENVTGNQTDYTYAYVSDVVVDIMIQKADFVEIVLEKITLGNSDVTLPQSQVTDINYYNP